VIVQSTSFTFIACTFLYVVSSETHNHTNVIQALLANSTALPKEDLSKAICQDTNDAGLNVR
jgi:hypothetical protein